MAAQFGASLTAIREAIITLETEGFVTKKPNTSTYITQLKVAIARKLAVRLYWKLREAGQPSAAGSYAG